MKYMFFLTSLFFMILLSSCTIYKTEGEPVSFKDKEVKLTILHTTDMHSKVLPFQFTPNSWDIKVGVAPQDPQGHCSCNEGYYPQGAKCLKKTNSSEHKCSVDSECSNSKHCYIPFGVCYDCYENSHCSEGEYCLNYECVKEDYKRVPCVTVKGRKEINCGEGTCYDDNGRQFYGGFARLGYLIELEKARLDRSVYLDSGDIYQGAPIFNFFQGEPEIRSMNALMPDSQVLGNHEFDEGVKNWVKQVSDWTSYPILGANYVFKNPELPDSNSLPSMVKPYTIVEKDGLKIGVVGLANTHTIISIYNAGNSMGIEPESAESSAQYFIDLIKDQVDLIVVNSHEGLNVDQHLCQVLKDVDVIVGGHHHVLTEPPQEIINTTTGGKCIMLHSGVNAKFLTMLGLTLKDVKQGDGFSGLEVVSVDFDKRILDNRVDKQVKESKRQIKLSEIGKSELSEKELSVHKRAISKYSQIDSMLENYEEAMGQLLDVNIVIGVANDLISRYNSNGGNSELGNLVADAMLKREFIDADFSITNSLGIRADLPKGDIKISKIFEIFPFNNSIMTMTLSGKEVKEMLDYVAFHSGERGCMTQVQVSGITATLDCKEGVAKNVIIGGTPLNEFAFYEVATNDYMGRGGSGFTMLGRVTTKSDTGIELRKAVINYIRQKQPLNAIDFSEPRLIMKR